MRHLLKTFLVCLLAGALLGQGITALASVPCGPQPLRSATVHADRGDDDQAQHKVGAGSEHDASANVLQATHGHCSLCAACCIGPEARSDDMRWDAAIDVARAPSIPMYSAYADYLPAALERPPRLQ